MATNVRTVTRTLTNEMKFINLHVVSLNDLNISFTTSFDTKTTYQCSNVYCATSNGIQNARKTISVTATKTFHFSNRSKVLVDLQFTIKQLVTFVIF